MKKIFTILFLFFIVSVNAQSLTSNPSFVTEASSNIEITMDANFGGKELLNYANTSDVYVHIGAITSKSVDLNDWKYVKFQWGTTNAQAQCSYLGNNKWKYTITGNVRTFFGIVDGAEIINKIAIIFRNGSGNKQQRNTDGSSNMYVSINNANLHVRIDQPFSQATYVPKPEPISKSVGDGVGITANSNIAGTLNLYFNGNLLATSSTTSVSANATIATPGSQQIIAEAISGANTARDTFNFTASGSSPIADLPAGLKDGINYEQGDTSVTLVLFAPQKSSVFVIGDFNNWTASSSSLMNVTPDKNRYWIKIKGLTPGTEYAYQYLIDGNIKVADYNTEKVLDPDNDKYISAETYPNLKAYPTGKTTGIVSVFQTAKPKYTWQVTSFSRPNKHNLMIYELLVRDFIAKQNWQTLKDTLSYLKRLGINAIEIMPFNEFEGNNSWGYNPSFYFAPDKAYGTETALKQLIDECHKQGLAVIMDIVLNHTFNQSPMAQMYWDAVNNRPAANNPWYNAVTPHAFGFGNDFNHESTATKDFFNRVLTHWLANYKIDGYRFDFSKGLTQKHSTNDAEFSAYDASRIAIINGYANTIKTADAGAYIILEHFCDNTEEKELSDNDGLMLWGNGNYNFNEATMGWIGTSNFSGVVHANRGWTQPNLVGYMESHDEERLMYKNEKYGNSGGSPNVKDTAVGLKRNGMAAAFWALIPGPKMLWEFGELGYDYSRCYLSTNGEGGDCDKKTDPKPIRWDYYNEARRKALLDEYSDLLRLRTTPAYLSTFTTGAINYNLAGAVKWFTVSDAALTYIVFGNFDVTNQSVTINFPSAGTWYSYLTDSVAAIASAAQSVTLKPGEYYVFTNKNLSSIALPVNWLSFTAEKATGETVLLKWSTAQETGNSYYSIEHSIDGNHFTSIGEVPAGKAATSVQNYQFTDKQPYSGNNYYRIKQVDKNGNFSYTPVRKINFDASAALWQLYPNPVSKSTALYVKQDAVKMQLILTDISGKVLCNNVYRMVKAGQRIPLVNEQLSAGIYLLKITSDKNTSTQKLVVE